MFLTGAEAFALKSKSLKSSSSKLISSTSIGSELSKASCIFIGLAIFFSSTAFLGDISA